MFSIKHTHQPMKASFYLQDFVELPQWVIAAPINQHILSDKSFVRPVRDDLQNNVWKRRWTFKWVKDKSKLRWQGRCHGNLTLKTLMQVWRRRFLSECFYWQSKVMLLGITSKSVQHETSFSLFLVAYLVGVFFFFWRDKQKNPMNHTNWVF